MVNRPYFQNSINDLEKLLEASKNDLKIVQAIYEELNYRKTNRAYALKDKVLKVLNTEEETHTTTFENDSNFQNTISEYQNDVIQAHTDVETSVSEPKSYKPKHQPIKAHRAEYSTEQILSAWTAMEVLTPQAIPSKQELEVLNRKLMKLDEEPEPWNDYRYRRRGRETAVYWMVYIGELSLSKTLESILQAFPDDASDERINVQGNTTLAVVVLDAKGMLIADKVYLSSFAWGYGKVREGDLKELAEFTYVEKDIKSEIVSNIIKQNEEGEIQPVSLSDIKSTITLLTDELNLKTDDIISSGIAIRVPQFSSYNEAPEPELLNSFFIEDISRIRNAFNENNIGQALKTYMGGIGALVKQDIVRDQHLLAETISPERLPLIRWPNRGRPSLYMMQQAAINHAVKELGNEGLIAVNGPPGTGKTTLLRDIVAKVALDRALAMVQFENPSMAFNHTASMKTGQAYSHLYLLEESLLGHEIVIASSNNKAVENISLEIPSIKAIADDFSPPLRYFQAISDCVKAGGGKMADGETWGLAAAVLGNSANKAAFIKSFWWDKQRGMATYLSAIINGIMQYSEEVPDEDETTDENEAQPFVPEVVRMENPPRNEIEALERWQATRKDFAAKYKQVINHIQKAVDIYKAVNKKVEVNKSLNSIIQDIIIAETDLGVAQENLQTLIINQEKAINNERKAVDDRKSLELLRPGIFSRIFKTVSYKEWLKRMTDNNNAVNEARESVKNISSLVEQSQNTIKFLGTIITKKSEEKINLEKQLDKLVRIIGDGQEIMGDNLADESFWQQDDATIQVHSPWTFKELQNARDELFCASFAVHRAFIDGSAKYVRHNIRAAIEMLKGRTLTDNQEAARRSLWASLFMVVPVVSTTFASMARLFKGVVKDQLGWLLIDEAGQATPQSALGAIWRARRVVVIGDPLQIEPVVTMPKKLVNSIFTQFNVSPDEWAAPDVSAQILADRNSWLGTVINSDDGELWVGAPLRVHRRCEQPMFSISNYIAYNGLMVYGTQPEQSEIGKILGQSKWINIAGEASGKWSENEGQFVLSVIKQLLSSGIADPKIFFITPFRIVSFKLREMIRNDHWIATHLPISAWEWTNERVGTIHTFQGKEAEAVVLVLGAPSESSQGARRWAGSMPNLLNVAVTRAKRRLYVVGNHQAWKNEGYFKYLASSLPLHKEKS